MTGILPVELILEILSWLPVTNLMRFRCVSKTWKFLISNSYLMKLHLERSSKYSQILLLMSQRHEREFLPRLGSLPCLIQNPEPSSWGRILQCPKPYEYLFGSCNGLLSLRDSLSTDEYEEHWVYFWNPATKICSGPSPRLRLNFGIDLWRVIDFGFGYDDRRDSYKVVAIILERRTLQISVWVYCMGDVCWRRPLMTIPAFLSFDRNGYSLNGTINWIGIYWEESRTHKLQNQIFSYDLNNDTCRCLSVPEHVPTNSDFPSMGVLNDCLCVSLDTRMTVFVVLALRDVRDERSWSRLMSVSYESLNICLDYYKLRILCMWDDLLLLTYSQLWDDYDIIIIFNLKENKIERTGADYLSRIFSYIPSLILPI
ncbi:F-box/kelch-repeat protein At3g23880-like [Vigna radiata var. radiata]|uniref:F-box/kelch-repeat protein At3g23880-like n=1 Tax=Vigna radiata var. radiata TaxID=3916 RepID=A0A1S3TPG5_VIGRR|nr:F-box/kelch-repeat protein At3g23880-like [Vigna radiata var. radiata]